MGKKEILVIALFLIIIIAPIVYKLKFSKKKKHGTLIKITVPKTIFYHRYKEVKEASIILLENLNNTTFFCKFTNNNQCIICRDNFGNILVIPTHSMIKCQKLCQNCQIKYKLFYYFIHPEKRVIKTDFLNVINNTTVLDLDYLSYFRVLDDCVSIGYKIKDSRYSYELIVCKDPKNINKLIPKQTKIVQKICHKNYCEITTVI